MKYKYFPVLRARQQEMDVLQNFDFGDKIIPIVEIIKEKARSNQIVDGHDGYADMIGKISAEKVLIDLPIYLDITTSTALEVRKFFLSISSNIKSRIKYFKNFQKLAEKVIPIISILQPYSDESNTLIKQFDDLSEIFPQIAIRIYINNFEEAFSELQKIILRESDLILYDIDSTEITNPLVKIQKKKLDSYSIERFKVIISSAINTEVQNVRLQHGEIVSEANNSLLELFNGYKFPAFGDFAGIKKDSITSGGTISPGFIFFNPEENLFYGYKGHTKSLSEFEETIVPDVLNSAVVTSWVKSKSSFIEGNAGYNKLVAISKGQEAGKSQAKFKWIAIMHYLHCVKEMINKGEI